MDRAKAHCLSTQLNGNNTPGTNNGGSNVQGVTDNGGTEIQGSGDGGFSSTEGIAVASAGSMSVAAAVTTGSGPRGAAASNAAALANTGMDVSLLPVALRLLAASLLMVRKRRVS